jgi:hypothetical protein
MNSSLADTLDKYDQWRDNYKQVCDKAIIEMLENGNAGSDNGLFLCKWNEINKDLIADLTLPEEELEVRVVNKLNFIRGYMIDISFDGDQFVDEKSTFLSLQYPDKCDDSLGVWLEQDLDDRIETGGYYGFGEFNISFFCNKIEDVDLASMRGVLRFNKMYLRRPKGVNWDTENAKDVLQKIKNDLEFDYEVDITIDDSDYDELLLLHFENWM